MYVEIYNSGASDAGEANVDAGVVKRSGVSYALGTDWTSPIVSRRKDTKRTGSFRGDFCSSSLQSSPRRYLLRAAFGRGSEKDRYFRRKGKGENISTTKNANANVEQPYGARQIDTPIIWHRIETSMAEQHRKPDTARTRHEQRTTKCTCMCCKV